MAHSDYMSQGSSEVQSGGEVGIKNLMEEGLNSMFPVYPRYSPAIQN